MQKSLLHGLQVTLHNCVTTGKEEGLGQNPEENQTSKGYREKENL